MKLLLDIGNTRIKWAWHGPQGLQPGGAVVHADKTTEQALAGIVSGEAPSVIWAASVAGADVVAAVNKWAASHGSVVRWVRSTAAACGVKNAYAQPERLGVDRWLAVIAAFHRAAGAAFVIDAGTALTVDVVDAGGGHQGGLIGPGIGTMRASIYGKTQIEAAPAVARPQALAQGTDDAVAWGTLVAALGFIEHAYANAAAEHGALPVYLTGGEAALLSPELPADWTVVPDLVLEGLALLAQAG